MLPKNLVVSSNQASSRALIASDTLANSSSSAVVLVSLTALPTMSRQRSMSLSPSSASSGILATAWSTILYASGSKNESIVWSSNKRNYLSLFFAFQAVAYAMDFSLSVSLPSLAYPFLICFTILSNFLPGGASS